MHLCRSFGGSNARPTLNGLLLLLLLVIAIRYWIWMPALVSGNSMKPTLRDGQMVAINKLAYFFRSPERGDVVFIWSGRELMIKRIIGLPGEEVALHDGNLYVNGRLFPEPYVARPGQLEVAPGKIPASSFVVIGDNRSGTAVAVINRKRIVGKLMRSGVR